jgi:hypothetical protein
VAAATQVFTDAGQAKAVTVLTTDATMKHIGWGSGTTAAAVTQTALVTANPEARTAGTITNPATNTYRVTGTITATATRVVEEVGLFDAASAGNMGIRATHGQMNLVSGDTITYQLNCVLKDSSE